MGAANHPRSDQIPNNINTPPPTRENPMKHNILIAAPIRQRFIDQNGDSGSALLQQVDTLADETK